MPKLRVFSSRDLIRMLESNGFKQVRQKGSHIVLQKEMSLSKANSQTITLIVPKHDEIAIGTLASIIRQSGLSRELF